MYGGKMIVQCFRISNNGIETQHNFHQEEKQGLRKP